MINKNLTIIIVTFNSEKIIANCLQNLNQNKYQIIVVDNASTDNTCQIIAEKFPSISLIKSAQNSGYGRANNMALRQVQTDFALILNPDCLIDASNIDKIIGIMTKDCQIAIAGPLIYNAVIADNQIISGDLCNRIKTKNQNDDCYFNQFITGAVMFFNMSLMRKIGFFDEGFFLYCEDNEICKRAQKQGYKTALIKNSKSIHLSGQSSVLTKEQITKIYWHKFGWSKPYYTQKIWGTAIGKLRAIRMIFKFSFLLIQEKINHQDITKSKAALSGCFSYLIGLGAFKKDGTARG